MSEDFDENESRTKTKKSKAVDRQDMSQEHLELTAKLHQELRSDQDLALSHLVQSMTPIIVTGYQGLPLLEVAKFMAKSKFCTQKINDQACLECVACQSVDKESSIHLKVIRPDGKFIKVDQIREVIEFLSFKRESTTIVIFENAHLMNLQAANALLKTLEEPPEMCWLLLTSPSIKNMLSTIRSRCLVYKARPLNLKNIGNNDLADHDLLQGRWDWFLKSDEILTSISDVRRWLGAVKDGRDLEPLDWMKGRDGLQELIMYLRLLAKESLKISTQNQNPVDSKMWVNLIDKLQRFEEALGSNVDSKLVEEQLFEVLKDSHVFH